MRAIQVQQHGGPEVLQLKEIAVPQPGAGEVLIEVARAGVNFADIGLRQGMMGGPHGVPLPYTPGFEVAGTIAVVGPDVTHLEAGQRVVSVLDQGGYAEYAVASADRTYAIPEQIDVEQATGLLVQGLTAYGVLHDAARIQPGEAVLVQAAAGGVGSLAVQLAKLAGAHTIIGTASSADKRALVHDLGATHVIDYTQADWVQQVYAATEGRGVDVVLESVGGTLGAQAFQALAPLGRFVMFGGASGPLQPPPDLMQLNIRGQSLIGYGGPWIRPGAADAARRALTEYMRAGKLRVVVEHRWPLAEAAAAHRALQARSTTGKLVLVVA